MLQVQISNLASLRHRLHPRKNRPTIGCYLDLWGWWLVAYSCICALESHALATNEEIPTQIAANNDSKINVNLKPSGAESSE
jgi:hypothetical protein